MIIVAPFAFGVAICAILWLAAVHDIRTLTIPHSFTFAMLSLLALAILIAIMRDISASYILTSLLGGMVALVIGFVMFLFRVMGAGDVKLFAAAAPFFPLGQVLWVFAFIAMVGLVWTLMFAAYSWFRRRGSSCKEDEGISNIRRLKVPYGPAIAGGVSLFLILSAASSCESAINPTQQHNMMCSLIAS